MSIILIFFANIFRFVGIISAEKIKGILKLTAKVPVMCALATISSVNFGSYVGTDAFGSGAIAVNCSPGEDFTISLGTGGSGFFNQRKMNNGSSLLNYNLYTNNTYVFIWGNGAGGTYNVSGVGTGVLQNYWIYGKIISGQNVSVGNYSDNIVVTIEY